MEMPNKENCYEEELIDTVGLAPRLITAYPVLENKDNRSLTKQAENLVLDGPKILRFNISGKVTELSSVSGDGDTGNTEIKSTNAFDDISLFACLNF